jgi:dTDP-4-dehydrorhamnose 3,5-epimerase
MQYEKTAIDGVVLIKQNPHVDSRGYFSRVFCEDDFAKNGINVRFVQSNVCCNNAKGTLRGLHTSISGYEEDKLVLCTRGKVFDVCVDVRENSPTYGKHVAVELSEENGYMLFIPKGCAHGYLTLESDCQLLYFMSEFYVQGTGHGFMYDDSFFSINWPLSEPYIISEQDKNWAYVGHQKG